MKNIKPAIWFPTVRTNTGTDRFTEQLVASLNQRGFQAEITWLPHHAEYLPWLVPVPKRPDWANIVHVNSWLAPRFIPTGIPIVTTVHLCVQDFAIRPYKSLAQHLYHKLWITPIERKCLERANCITAVSQYTATCVEHVFNIHDIKVIYNGINTGIFSNYQRGERKKDNLFVLLFVGTNSVRKGFDLLPQIMKNLGNRFELLYTQSVSNVSVASKNMKAIPYQSPSDLARLYRSVDALIFPSRLEGFGLVVAEAMACGLPVIITDGSALNELVEHGVTGFLCEQDNIDDFVKTIKHLQMHPELCVTVGKRASDIAVTRFNIEDMLNQYIGIYKNLL